MTAKLNNTAEELRPWTPGSNGYGWAGLPPDRLYERINAAIEEYVRLKHKLNFDAIAFTGSSGCAIAFGIASKHKETLIYVRKDEEQCHGSAIEVSAHGSKQIRTYLNVDDFVSAGETVFRIIDKVTERSTFRGGIAAPQCVGVLCFSSRSTVFSDYHDKIRLRNETEVPLVYVTVNRSYGR